MFKGSDLAAKDYVVKNGVDVSTILANEGGIQMVQVVINEDSKTKIQSLFKEELELELAELTGAEESYRLISIDGNKQPEDENVYIKVYRDDIYLNPPRVDYKGTLLVYNYGKSYKYLEYCYKKRIKESEKEKLSIYDAIKKMYNRVLELN